MSSYRPRHLAPSSSDPEPTGASRRSLLRGGVLGAAALGTGVAALGPAAARADGFFGQDVSGWQGEVDWAAQREMGSRFAYVKATEGRSYRSPAFDHQYLGAGGAGLVRGGYHFARPDSGGPEEQVDFFLNNGGGWSADGITLPGMVDLEGYHGLPRDYGLSQQEMREWIHGFSVRYRDQVGRRPVLYTNLHWWNDVVGDWTPPNSPLFLASYHHETPTTMPGRWWAWELWQYSDNGPFAGDSVRWHGSAEEFERFVTDVDYDARGI
ncbi:GH25 family lysozyme [Brachybacterium sp. YJGR34]|uniref:GH25 family lysozyme n=1 Tax=Brachybacterium sp. YJGR34 TaxID=2059911 RepID=UPI000E0A0E60|nr:GH25 family lysozyme [Brachybacterium sp. YJGR34]